MRALIVAAEGTTDEEFIYPFYRLQEARFAVDVMVLNGPNCRGVAGVKIAGNAAIGSLSTSGWDGDLLVLPGGVKAIEKLRQHKPLIEFIATHHARGGVIASICHGAQLLISAKLCRNRPISGYYSIRDDIENAGGTYIDGVVAFDRIASCAHYKDMAEWMRLVLREVGA